MTISDNDATMKLDEIFNPEMEDNDATLRDIFLFVQGAYEIAFGDGAIEKGYTPSEVLTQLLIFSDDAHDLAVLNAEEHTPKTAAVKARAIELGVPSRDIPMPMEEL